MASKMRSIDVIDSIEIFANPDVVFSTVIDYANTSFWFPQYRCKVIACDKVHEGCEVKHRLSIGSFITLSSFTRRIDHIVANQSIEESYIAGDLLGTGTWQFTATNNRSTFASYHCKVTANNFRINAGFIVAGEKAHSLTYQYLLKRLKNHCESIVKDQDSAMVGTPM